jgi:hypothetical protein
MSDSETNRSARLYRTLIDKYEFRVATLIGIFIGVLPTSKRLIEYVNDDPEDGVVAIWFQPDPTPIRSKLGFSKGTYNEVVAQVIQLGFLHTKYIKGQRWYSLDFLALDAEIEE